MDTPTPRCERCRDPFWPEQDGQKYCSARCREAAKKRRQRFRLRRGKEAGELLVPQGTGVVDESLTELHEQAGPLRDWRDDPRSFSDFGDVPGDFELAAEIDAQREEDARFNAMIRQDEDRRTPRRRSWFDLRQVYNSNPGVELSEITQERIERHKAEQAAIQARLRSSKGQPQDRYNDVTKDVVATKGTESRQRNRVFANADPRPQSYRQEFSFEAESVDGSFYRQGRASGHRARYSDYAWRMDGGFIHSGF
jgi:hypothetical protein